MNPVKSKVNNIAAENVETFVYTDGYAIVTKANEYNNVCDIRYRDSRSRIKNHENVVVISDNENWFPSVGEPVRIMMYEDNVGIVGKKQNWERQRDKSTIKTDIYCDEGDSSIGGTLF
jgi:hypothetical protein